MKKRLSKLLIAIILITSLPFGGSTFAENPELDLIISEYVEGGGYNKAIELYNGTENDIDLSAYSIAKDVNGNGTFTPVSLVGTIEKDKTFVISCKDSRNDLSATSDLDLSGFSFNGDDQVALFKGEVTIDTIGIPGGTNFGKDKTFVRLPNITAGNTNALDPGKEGSEWLEFSKDTYSYLGDHNSILNKGVKPVTSNAVNGSELTKDTVVELSTLTAGASIKVAIKTGDVYGDYTDYAPITVTEAISFKAKAIKEGVESAETEFTYTVLSNIPVVSIKEAKAAYVDILPEKPDFLDDNGKVLIEGVVTAIIDDYIYVQDAETGLGVKVSGVIPSIGDKVSIYGQLGTKYDFTYLNVESAADFKIIASDQEVKAVAVTLDEIGDAVEGQLIKIENITTGAGNQYGEFSIVDAASNTILKPIEKIWLADATEYESYTGVVYYGYSKFQILSRDVYDIVQDSSKVRELSSNVPSGMVSKDTAVTLTTFEKDAVIYYTTDGSEPDDTSSEYKSPVVITRDTTLKAVATKSSLTNSDVLMREYVVNESIGAKTISEIQGAGHISSFESKTAENVEGIVTALINYKFGDKRITGFYMQGNSDNNDDTSDAIMVYTNDVYEIGDAVTVTGTVTEQVKEQDFYAYDQENQLSVTTLQNTTITVNSKNNPLPEAVVLGEGGRVVPHDKISSDNFSSYDVALYAIDFYESLEGMLVTANNPVVVGAQVNRVVTIVPDNAAVAKADGDFNSEGGVVLTDSDFNTERLPLSGAITSTAISHLKTVKMGEVLDGSIKGIMEYEWGAYMIYLTENAPAVKEAKANDDTYKFEINDAELRIGSFNVYNHGGEDDAEKTTGIAKQIVSGMQSPDIIGLVEVQDNDSAENTNVTDASKTYQLFIDEIVKLGGPLYKWTDIEPEEDKEGGEPGGNIRVGFLYNPARVSLKEGTKGGTFESVAVDGDAHLTLNPGRINPQASAFDGTRKSLAAEFVFNGEEVIVIANHLKSKGGDNAIYGNVQQPVLNSEAKRVEQAQIINDFIDSVVAVKQDANIVVMGDFNDYQFSNPIKALEGPETVVYDMINSLPLTEQFTYMYGGNAQVLDHILVTGNLIADTKIDVININSILSKTDSTRFSDHDPVVVAIANIGNVDYVNSVSASIEGDVVEGTEVTLAPDNATIYYSFDTLDLDNLSNNMVYSGPITITGHTTIEAVAVKGDFKSDVNTFSYTVVVPAVSATPVGLVEKNTEVTLTCESADVTIYYATGEFNTEDITKNKEYKNPISIKDTSTLTAVAVKNGFLSPITTFDYTVISFNTVEEARAFDKGTEVILDVIITSTPGSFGYKTFTFQDDTGAGYVYTRELDDMFVEGSHVRLIGKTDIYNELFQIKMTSVELLDEKDMPKAKQIKLEDIGETYESQLVSLKNLRVGEIRKNSKNNAYIDVVSKNEVVTLKLDSRSGDDFDTVIGKVKIDDTIDVTGVVLDYKGTYTFTLRSINDITVTSKRSQLDELKTLNLSYQEVTSFNENEFINVSVTSKLDKDESGMIIFKVEKEGQPYRFAFANANTGNGHYATGFDTTGMSAGSYTVTVYLWNDLVFMKPLATPLSTTFEIE